MQATRLRSTIELAPNFTPLYIKAPGSCGELMQGAIDEQDFLINCPINLFSYAKLQATTGTGAQLHNVDSYTKIRDTLMLVEKKFSLNLNHHLKICSDVPRGKGMASSSADITVAFEAVCRHYGVSLTAEAFVHIVTEIEPSDGVNFSGITHLNHLTGLFFESMPTPQDMDILVVDCGGQVNTMTFDRMYARDLYRNHQPYLRETLKMLKHGLHKGKLELIAKAATQSALFNQQIHYKAPFDDLLRISRMAGALGVNCAHSGTVLGVMFRSDDELKERLINDISQHFGSDLSIIGRFRMVSGGCYEC